ncbi:MAG: Mur ligase family protein [Crocinitomicaceae bacterium]|nr:Mur ligase family protein [Crocinitomicaceae bacterium]MDG2506323.1 Mur ligase family protein [Crocinitomicaceae bacterium]
MTQDNYKSKIDWLFHQFPAFQKQGGMAYKPGLSHTQKLLEYFKLDVRKLNTVHVAGTNGKGSTCSILASLLTESKKKVGLFTSPHIFDFRERIRVNGTMISEKEVSKFVEDVQSLKLDFKPSFFEITFVLAVKHFLDQNCDYCVFETGMGGRLDATNVLTPIATAITNISLDHTEFLGDTLEEIAKEKAGIIKANTPLFIGIKEPHSFSIFEALTKENSSKIIITDNRYTVRDIPKYQNENLNLAVQIHEYITQDACSKNELENAWQNIKKNTGYAKRMESISQKPQIFLDVAHNDEGILASIKFCRQKTKGKLFVIFGGAKDKKYNDTTLELLNETFLSFCLFSNERTKSIEDWQEVQKSLTKKNPIYLSIHEALNKTKPALKPNDTLLVTGSFFLISDFNPAFWK